MSNPSVPHSKIPKDCLTRSLGKDADQGPRSKNQKENGAGRKSAKQYPPFGNVFRLLVVPGSAHEIVSEGHHGSLPRKDWKRKEGSPL